jgi:hypothetical protein
VDLFVVVHGGVRRLPDGRPVLHISYVDHAAAERMYATDSAKQKPFRRLDSPRLTWPGGWILLN